MKNRIYSLLIGLALTTGVHQVRGQTFITNSLSQNGVLVCSGLQTGTVATVAWSSALSGPWQTNWSGLTRAAASDNGTIRVSVPMTNRVSTFYRIYVATNSSPSGMALIPAGSFTMGDVADTNLWGDAAPIAVNVSAFYMDVNLVSYSQWQAVYNWATNHGYLFDSGGASKAANHPVQSVDWYDCVKWCNARSQLAGKAPVYYTDAGLTQIYTNAEVTIYPNWTAKGYRLPTEAEWEKAARGGLSGKRFPWGNTISESLANYEGDTKDYFYDLGPNSYNATYATGNQPYTSPVGSFAPNGYGLYDMAGNVFEWCWDWYGSQYAGGSDPSGPPTGAYRLSRGGGWTYSAVLCRTATRLGELPSTSINSFGFRCVLPPSQ